MFSTIVLLLLLFAVAASDDITTTTEPPVIPRVFPPATDEPPSDPTAMAVCILRRTIAILQGALLDITEPNRIRCFAIEETICGPTPACP